MSFYFEKFSESLLCHKTYVIQACSKMTKRHSPGTRSMISKGNNLEHRIFPWRWQIKAEKRKKMEIHSDGNFFLYSFSISASVTSISIAICIEAFEATVKVLYCVFPFYIFLLFIFTVFLAFFLFIAYYHVVFHSSWRYSTIVQCAQ